MIPGEDFEGVVRQGMPGFLTLLLTGKRGCGEGKSIEASSGDSPEK